MGKPIARTSQFPYSIDGFMVNGAKINGITYVKKLFIYKQRSDLIYDLIDIYGNVYQFISLTHRDDNNNELTYFSLSSDLTSIIPNNTFFIKVQEPLRNIYSFLRLYQLNKIICSDGNYIFRPDLRDTYLSSVQTNPERVSIQLNNTQGFTAIYTPENYTNKSGKWIINSLDGVDGVVEILSSTDSQAIVKGLKVGRALVSYIPDGNTTIISHSLVEITDDDSSEIKYIFVEQTYQRNEYLLGEDIEFSVITDPVTAVLTSPPEIIINDTSSLYSKNIELRVKSISEDNRTIIISTYPIDPDIPTGAITEIRTNVGFYYKETGRANYYYFDIAGKAAPPNYADYDLQLPSITIPGKTYKASIFVGNERYGLGTFTSSNPSVEFNPVTSEIIISPDAEDGYFNITRTNDSGQKYTTSFSFISRSAYDFIEFEPAKVRVCEFGSPLQLKTYGVRGSDRTEFKFEPIDDQYVTLTGDGLYTKKDDDSTLGQAYSSLMMSNVSHGTNYTNVYPVSNPITSIKTTADFDRRCILCKT